MVLRSIASSHKVEKSKESKKDIPAIISYNGQNYRIPMTRLRNLGLNYWEEVRQYCIERGLDPMPDFDQQCLFCDNNSNSIQAFYSGDAETDKEGNRRPGLDCRYVTSLEFRLASSYENKETGQTIMAVMDDCVFFEGLVKVLCEHGALDQYKIEDTSFPYRLIGDFEIGMADPKEYEIKPPLILKKASSFMKVSWRSFWDYLNAPFFIRLR
ncbi:hypothetical protein COU57_05395 [Candidatus Pacearchaeota archaeon CG10_big_fil_rev_8_21_14_0_10_32_14]|nr:MAG: hypothetical protein COU57_05395 [Candidatus Pacearchaeota archaeon CG10_big_fil_rev_8_21_14_0_10_32_14]